MRATKVIEVLKPIVDRRKAFKVGEVVELFAEDADFHIKAGHAKLSAAAAPPVPPPSVHVIVAPEVAAEQ